MKLSGSWRTSALGIASILAAISSVITALLDADPNTNPNWPLVGAAITAGLQGLFARDNKVSSEQAGAGVLKPGDPGYTPPSTTIPNVAPIK